MFSWNPHNPVHSTVKMRGLSCAGGYEVVEKQGDG